MRGSRNNQIKGFQHLTLACWLSVWILFSPALALTTWAQTPPSVRGQISVVQSLQIADSDAKVSLKLREADLRDVLNILARQGGFNVLLDSTVTGTLTVDLNDVSINKALEYLITVGQLSYSQDDQTLIITSLEAAEERQLVARTFQAIPVRYKNAEEVAERLNETLFKSARAGTRQNAVASFDPDSNALLILGTQNDIDLVTKALQQLDVPRNRRVYSVKHSTPAYLAQVLAANFFGLGSGAGAAAGAAGAAGAGGAAGAAGAGGGAAGGGGAAAGAAGAAGGAGPTLLPISSGGVTFIPEPVSSTLTVLGTLEQLALVDSVIEELDVRRPQVQIEVSLVELNRSNTKVHQPGFTGLNFGEFNISILGAGGTNTFSTGNASVGGGINLPEFNFINSLRESKGRILANPTIVALDNTTSSIEITDQVATFSFTVTQGVAGNTIVPTPTVQDVGITLSLTPQISNDGSVTLNIQPEVTQLTDIVEGGDATTGIQQVPLIASRNLNVSAVRVLDGQTLVLGGLLQETRLESLDKVPGLANLPILGAMFRASGTGGNTNGKTELIVMVTPHILKDDATTYSADNKLHQKTRSKSMNPPIHSRQTDIVRSGMTPPEQKVPLNLSAAFTEEVQ